MIAAAILAFLAGLVWWLVWFTFWWLPRQPGDRSEDRAQSDRDVQLIADSAGVPLETKVRRVRGLSS